MEKGHKIPPNGFKCVPDEGNEKFFFSFPLAQIKQKKGMLFNACQGKISEIEWALLELKIESLWADFRWSVFLDELIQWCKKKRKHLLVFKVDFEKAFDSVRWDFLDDLLFKFGFGGKWRKWIQSCLRSSRGSIILNGSPTEEFQFHKGLKQGDPLSPLLFILVMESLHLSFNRVEEAGLFNGIQLNSSINISHLFYADDAVFVGQWCEKNINTLVHILECFFRASGLRINMSKSKLMGLNVDNGKIKEAALKLGCLTLKPPFTYLGSTVGGSMSRIQAWDGVVERVKSRLSKWKVKMLSIGGRLTLLKSVLGSMAIYQMSIHKAPLGVLRNLESLRSHFFNGCAPNNQKASWVNWKNALASKEKGGLGISSLYALNRGLMFKWYWRFFTKDSSLWSRVIKAIYGDSGGLERNTFATYTSCWSNIVKEVTSLDEKGLNLCNAICFKLGNGEKARFWEDRWLDGMLFKTLFPRLYALELCKDCTVASKICDYTFDSSFRRPPRGGVEQEQFMALLSLVKDIQLVPMEDRWSWSLSSSGEFSVSSVRRLIDDKTLPDATQKTRWVRLVPIKINVHAWKVKSNSLPTRFNISRRGILIDSLKCGTCDMGVETVNHLFFSCTLVRNLVDLIVRWWNVTRVDIDSYSDWDLWIQNLRLPIKNKRMLEGVFYIMWWKDPEGILGPPSTGHLARREFQRRLEHDAEAREDYQRQLLEEKERRRKLRESRRVPENNSQLVEYFLDTEAQELELEIARMRYKLTDEFFNHLKFELGQLRFAVQKTEFELGQLRFAVQKTEDMEERVIELEALQKALLEGIQAYDKLQANIVKARDNLNKIFTSKDVKATLLDMVEKNEINRPLLALLDENIASARRSNQTEAADYMEKVRGAVRKYYTV
ncbi:RNA-directed DNA polymerase, eukaryota, reverse transcriptase zinc-binding domain protein, partial [Tanacetum coccineum]